MCLVALHTYDQRDIRSVLTECRSWNHKFISLANEEKIHRTGRISVSFYINFHGKGANVWLEGDMSKR